MKNDFGFYCSSEILQDNHNHRLYVQLGFVHQNKLSTLLFCLCLHVQRYSLQTVICCMGS